MLDCGELLSRLLQEPGFTQDAANAVLAAGAFGSIEGVYVDPIVDLDVKYALGRHQVLKAVQHALLTCDAGSETYPLVIGPFKRNVPRNTSPQLTLDELSSIADSSLSVWAGTACGYVGELVKDTISSRLPKSQGKTWCVQEYQWSHDILQLQVTLQGDDDEDPDD